ncbi:hypothetical protein ACWD4B_01475 [Streptomyces sp. NPDC002536]
MPHPDDLSAREIEAITTGLLRLSRQLDRAERPEDIATVLTPIIDRHEGALHRIAQIFEAIGRLCNDFVEQDSYAMDLQDISDDAYSALASLIDRLHGFDAQFRTFTEDITRIPAGHRTPGQQAPALCSRCSSATDSPSGDQYRQQP